MQQRIYLISALFVSGGLAYHPTSMAAAILLGSNSSTYNMKLHKFTQRVINCTVHQKYMPKRFLHKECRHIIEDYPHIKEMKTECKIIKTSGDKIIPCFPDYSDKYITRTVARHRLLAAIGIVAKAPPMYFYFSTSL